MFGCRKNYLLFFKKLKTDINQQKYLIAPLDWGLGHATRCIPLISYLLGRGHKVFICGEGAVEALLKKEFPAVEFLPLRGYKISYTQKRGLFMWKILLQLPKIYFAIRRERSWLNQTVARLKIDVVISDNRLGMCCSMAYSIYMSHQLAIQTGNGFMDIVAQRIHYSFINRFNECWVPDLEKEIDSIAGRLSHPKRKPKIPFKYIGWLSRAKPEGADNQQGLVVLISGPEPQRTIFENRIVQLLKDYTGKAIVVRGLPDGQSTLKELPTNIKQANHLDSAEISHVIKGASVVVSRSGYSTVMDLLKMGKRAILVPTPGQTEQEYLASYLQEQGYFLSRDQDRLCAEDFKVELPIKKTQAHSFALFEEIVNSVENKRTQVGFVLPNR